MTFKRKAKARKRAGGPDPSTPVLWGVWIGPEDERGEWYGAEYPEAVLTWTSESDEAWLIADEVGGVVAPYLKLGDILSPKLTARLLKAVI